MTDSTQNNVTDTPVSDSTRQQGIVKWFNNRSGFGFVTTLGDDKKDIFVHHSGVSVDREQYKYLVQGEYVNFMVKTTENEEHPHQAYDVTGLFGGMLMCETRNEIRQNTAVYNESKGRESGGKKRQNNRRQRRGESNSNEKWVVQNRNNSVEESQ